MSSPDRQVENQTPRSGFTLRKMYEFYQGPVYKRFARLPLYNTQLSPEQIMRYKTIMDYMTEEELDLLNPMPSIIFGRRVPEIVRMSGQRGREVIAMLHEHNRLKKVWKYVERKMSDTMMMDMAALFWSEMHSASFPEQGASSRGA